MFVRRFAEGDRVVVIGGEADKNRRPGVYTIIRLMPLSQQGFQYRVKAALDTHERVMDDHALAPAR